MMSIQNPYTLLNRTYEVGLAEMSIREKTGLLAYSPLAVVIYLVNIEIIKCLKILELKEIQIFGQDMQNLTLKKLLMRTMKLLKNMDLDLAQMSLKFLEIQPFVTSVIIGATTMEQLKTNIESVNINLTDDVIQRN